MHPTIERLRDAMNRHDPAGMAATMSPDYRSEQPAHPNRGFSGHGQVATNWTEMFRGVPDLTAEVVSDASDGRMTWSEWRWRGTRLDGTPFASCGVIVGGLTENGLVQWFRLYMEPVEEGGAGIEETVHQLSGLR